MGPLAYTTEAYNQKTTNQPGRRDALTEEVTPLVPSQAVADPRKTIRGGGAKFETFSVRGGGGGECGREFYFK